MYERVRPVLGPVTRLFRDAARVSLDLFKVMVPVLVAVKVLKELGAIEYIGLALAPVMGLVGLPGAMGLVWATALCNSIYTGMVVYASLAGQYPLSVAQVTVLATMMLIAHSLPVELKIADKTGARLWMQGVIRVASALIFGVVFSRLCRAGDWLSGPSQMFWQPEVRDPGLVMWALGEAGNLIGIFVIILGLMAMMTVLTRLRVTYLAERLLSPVMRAVGIGRSAGTITIIGMILGLSYGGGLIMHEVKTGRVDRRDVFYSVTFMGLSHALIEDTVLMLVLGASIFGVFWGRLLFSLAAMFLLVRLMAFVPERIFSTWFLSAGPGKGGSSENV